MGLLYSRPQESISAGAPAFRTPFTDITAPIGHHDKGECLPYNLRYVDCLEAYGPIKGKEKCKEVFQDFVECALKWKQMMRVENMKDERFRQWFMGMRGSGEKVPLAPLKPSADTFVPSFNMEEP